LAGWFLQGIGNWLYMIGGRSNKWIRRFIGAIFCTSAVCAEALLLHIFSFWMLLDYPLTVLSFHLGYGSERLKTKIAKRSLVVAASLLSGILFCLIIGGKAWLILPLHVLIASGSIYLGVVNPIQAAAEEFFVCALLRVCNIMYVFSSMLILIK
jgi:hypothetical protein